MTKYNITRFDPWPGSDRNYVNALNNSAQAAGSTVTGTTMKATAWPWPNAQGNLGPDSSSAVGINNLGRVVGHMRQGPMTKAFISSVLQAPLQPLPDPSSQPFLTWWDTFAADINDSGIIAYNASVFPLKTQHASLYASIGSTFTPLLPLPGHDSCYVAAVSNTTPVMAAGSSVKFSTEGVHAYRYDGQMHDLGKIGPVELWGAEVNDINDSGRVVGAGKFNGKKYLTAFFCDQPNALNPLTPPAGVHGSIAHAVNSDGVIVGRFHGLQSRAFVCENQTDMVLLDDLIPANSGWVLQEATDINDAGQIVGSGTWNGAEQGFLLTPIVIPSARFLNDLWEDPLAVIFGSTSATYLRITEWKHPHVEKGSPVIPAGVVADALRQMSEDRQRRVLNLISQARDYANAVEKEFKK